MSNSSVNQLSVTLLGPPIEHRDSLTAMLEGRVGRVSWVPDSITFRQAKNAGLRGRWKRLIDQVCGTSDPEYIKHITNSLDESGSRVVIAYWGTLPLPDLAALKMARPNVRVVLMVLCYPLALSGFGISRQNFFMRRAAEVLDGMLFPSPAMQNYFAKWVLLGRMPWSTILSPCWPASFQSAEPAAPIEPSPNLIFIGRTDLAGRTAQRCDDVRPLMRQILDAGIDLHHVYSSETDDSHPRRKSFAPVGMSELVQKVSGFDASLVAYNTDACPRDDRFWLTVPDRLITSVAAGVPVAIPRKGYLAAKEYLKDYPAVIEFDSPEQLARVLADRSYIARLRQAAWNARQNYSAARHGADLQRFLEQLLGLGESVSDPNQRSLHERLAA
jgi:hypothetical protein